MFKVQLKGFRELKALVKSSEKGLHNAVSGEIEDGAKKWVGYAKRDAPKNLGRLAGAIGYAKSGNLSFDVFVAVKYAAYMEFGTKGNYQPIPGTEEIAAQAKGKGTGSIDEFFDSILEWVRLKGIGGAGKNGKYTGNVQKKRFDAFDVAFRIMMSILKHGVKPHPYFFKQMNIVYPDIVKNVKKEIESKSKVSVIMPGGISRPQIITI